MGLARSVPVAHEIITRPWTCTTNTILQRGIQNLALRLQTCIPLEVSPTPFVIALTWLQCYPGTPTRLPAPQWILHTVARHTGTFAAPQALPVYLLGNCTWAPALAIPHTAEQRPYSFQTRKWATFRTPRHCLPYLNISHARPPFQQG